MNKVYECTVEIDNNGDVFEIKLEISGLPYNETRKYLGKYKHAMGLKKGYDFKITETKVSGYTSQISGYAEKIAA